MSTDLKEGKSWYALLIFIGCCCLCAGGYGSILSTVAVYVVPVVTALGCGVGDYMLFMTLFSIAACVTMPVWGKMLHTKNIRVVSTVAVAIVLVAQLMFAFGASFGVAWYWAWGTVLGLSLACTGALIPPVLINNWFDKSVAGKYLGIAAACSGFGAFVFAPLFTQFIAMFGYQMTYFINVAIAAALMLPFTLFVFRYKPEEMGLAPYGSKGTPVQTGGSASREIAGMTKKEALRSGVFYVLIFMLVCITLVYGFNSNMVSLAQELAAGFMSDPAAIAMLGATMVSAASIGNVLSKVLFGFVSDKLGISATFLGFTVAILVAFVLWAFFPDGEAILLVGAFLFGFNAALANVGFPLLARALFGDREYGPIYSTIASANALIGGVSATIIGYVYQLSGSYEPALIGSIVVVVVFGACYIAISGKVKKGMNA